MFSFDEWQRASVTQVIMVILLLILKWIYTNINFYIFLFPAATYFSMSEHMHQSSQCTKACRNLIRLLALFTHVGEVFVDIGLWIICLSHRTGGENAV